MKNLIFIIFSLPLLFGCLSLEGDYWEYPLCDPKYCFYKDKGQYLAAGVLTTAAVAAAIGAVWHSSNSSCCKHRHSHSSCCSYFDDSSYFFTSECNCGPDDLGFKFRNFGDCTPIIGTVVDPIGCTFATEVLKGDESSCIFFGPNFTNQSCMGIYHAIVTVIEPPVKLHAEFEFCLNGKTVLQEKIAFDRFEDCQKEYVFVIDYRPEKLTKK